jgi:hypothetical protein
MSPRRQRAHGLLYRIEISSQAADTIRTLPPEVKRQIKQALVHFTEFPHAGKPLTDDLAGLHSYRARRSGWSTNSLLRSAAFLFCMWDTARQCMKSSPEDSSLPLHHTTISLVCKTTIVDTQRLPSYTGIRNLLSIPHTRVEALWQCSVYRGAWCTAAVA